MPMSLDVRGLTVDVEGKRVLNDLSLSIGFGETVLLMGPNGSGKSSLILSILGHPNYMVKSGTIRFNGKDITSMPTEERALLGLGVSFQFPPKIRGVTLRSLARRLQRTQGDDANVEKAASLLSLNGFLDRDIHVGFSGGEIKRAELFFLLLQRPILSLIDEPDSGVDVENMATVGGAINELMGAGPGNARERPSALIVTHTGHISRYVLAQRTYLMQSGRMICYGETEGLVNDVLKHGFDWCAQCYGRRQSVVGEPTEEGGPDLR
jgi:Fe-S cluster assembly ATP-binding protein